MTGEPRPGSRSTTMLAQLQALPRLVLPAGVLVLTLVGLIAAPPVAVVALLVVFALVFWLATLSWAALDRRGQLLRLVVLGAIGGVLIGRVTQLF